MRIMIDTNIIVSAALFPQGSVAVLLKHIVRLHKLYICTFSIEELLLVVNRKFSHRKSDVDNFLCNLSYELIYTPQVLDKSKMPAIRDENDYPILLSAVNADVDILLSGDKDLIAAECERPEIIMPKAFCEKYLR